MGRCTSRVPPAAGRLPGARLVSVLLLAGVLLAGCGFQLRGVVALPPEMSATYLDAPDRFSTLYRSLRSGLAASGVQIVDERSRATAVLHVHSEETGERVLAVSARNVPREFEVFYIVDFGLSINGDARLVNQQLVETRSYTWNETQVLGKAEEGRRVQRALAEDLVVRMLQQISSVD